LPFFKKRSGKNDTPSLNERRIQHDCAFPQNPDKTILGIVMNMAQQSNQIQGFKSGKAVLGDAYNLKLRMHLKQCSLYNYQLRISE